MDPNFHVSSATFSYKFQNFSQITKLTNSPACWIQNLPWKIFIGPTMKHDKKFLSIFVGCSEPITKDRWSCNATIKMYKLHGTVPKIVKTTKRLLFDSVTSTSWGHVTFLPWDYVINPLHGFLVDDSITVEVTIDAELPAGVKLTEDHYTDERVKPKIDSYESSMKELKDKLEDLQKLNDENSKVIEELKRTNSEKISQLTADNKKYEELLATEKSEKEMLRKVMSEKDSQISSAKQELNQTQEECAKTKVVQPQTNEPTNSSSKELNEAKNKIIQLEKENEENMNKLEAEKQKLQDKINEFSTKIKNQTDEIQKLNTEKSNLITQINTTTEKFTKLNTEKANLELQLNIANSKPQNDVQKDDSQVKKLTLTLKLLNDQNSKLSAEKSKLETDLEAVKKKLEQEQTSSSQKFQKLNSEKSNLNELKEKLENDLAEIKKKLQDQTQKLVAENSNLNSEKMKLQSDLEDVRKKLSELSNKSQDIQKLSTENMNLLSKHREITEQLKNSKLEKEKLTKQQKDLLAELNSIKTELSELKANQRIIKDNVKKRTIENESNLKIDLNEPKNISKKNPEPLRTSKVFYDEGEIESLKKMLEKRIKDVDFELEEQRKIFMKRISEQQFKLDSSKLERMSLMFEKKRSEGDLERMRNELNNHDNAKKNLLITLRDSNKLTQDSFRIVVEIMKNLKTKSQLPCSVEKRLEILFESIDEKNISPTIQLLNNTNSSSLLQEKLEYLEKHLENELKIITQEYSDEKTKNIKLNEALSELSDLMNYKRKLLGNYKELLKISESKLEDFRVKLNELDNQLYDSEKKKSFAEQECRRLSKCIESQEVEIDELKEKLWKKVHADIRSEENSRYDEKFNSDEKMAGRGRAGRSEEEQQDSITKPANDANQTKTETIPSN